MKTKPVLYETLSCRAPSGLLSSLKEGTLVFWMSKIIHSPHFFSPGWPGKEELGFSNDSFFKGYLVVRLVIWVSILGHGNRLRCL